MAPMKASVILAATERVTGRRTLLASAPKAICSSILIVTLVPMSASIFRRYSKVFSDAVFASASLLSLTGGIFSTAAIIFILNDSTFSVAFTICFSSVQPDVATMSTDSLMKAAVRLIRVSMLSSKLDRSSSLSSVQPTCTRV